MRPCAAAMPHLQVLLIGSCHKCGSQSPGLCGACYLPAVVTALPRGSAECKRRLRTAPLQTVDPSVARRVWLTAVLTACSHRQLLRFDAGLLYPSGDIDEAVRLTRDLVAHPEKRQQMGAAARKEVSHDPTTAATEHPVVSARHCHLGTASGTRLLP